MRAACSDFFFRLRQAIGSALQSTNSSKDTQGQINKLYYSLSQRFFLDLLNSFKVPAIAEHARKALADNYSVVIGLQSTGEASLNKAVEVLGSKTEHDELVSSAKHSLLSFIREYFPTAMEYKPLELPTVESLQERAADYASRDLTFNLEEELAKRELAMKEDERRRATLGTTSAEAEQLKADLLAAVEQLPIPPSPLDALIDTLGGQSQVAEMTGRKGRLVKNRHGKYVYELRDHGGGSGTDDALDTLNIRERKAFMDGKKRVAIISDAASTGISLHSATTVPNQSRRVHITLELAWSADKTLQQLGRSHRAGQASAPDYKLVITDVGGERRRASAVARRLMSLGALTRGDRRAATVASFTDFDFESKYGRLGLNRLHDGLKIGVIASEVLRPVLASPPMPLPVTGDEEEWLTSEAVKAFEKLQMDKEGTKGGVKKFLNRMLMLPVPEQNLLFGLFSSFMDLVVADARRAGTYDQGVADLRARHAVLEDEEGEVVWKDQEVEGGGVAVAHTVVMDRGISFADALQIMEEAKSEDPDCDVAFYQSRRETWGRYLYLMAIRKNSALSQYYVTRPNTGRHTFEMLEDELIDKYRRVSDPQQVAKAWDEIYDMTCEGCIHGPTCKMGAECNQGSRKQRIRVICGSVLPIWGALEQTIIQNRAHITSLESKLNVVRVQLDDGRRLVGVRFPSDDTILQGLKQNVMNSRGANQNNNPNTRAKVVVEDIKPVDTSMVNKAARAKRTLDSFFGPAVKKAK